MNKMKLYEIIPKLKWREFTSCAISANIDDDFGIIACRGHNGNGKSMSFSDRKTGEEISMVDGNCDDLVDLAYQTMNGGKSKRLEQLNEKINSF